MMMLRVLAAPSASAGATAPKVIVAASALAVRSFEFIASPSVPRAGNDYSKATRCDVRGVPRRCDTSRTLGIGGAGLVTARAKRASRDPADRIADPGDPRFSDSGDSGPRHHAAAVGSTGLQGDHRSVRGALSRVADR